jgi:acyl dehydratase
MEQPGVVLGERLGPFDGAIDASLLERYAAATKDPSALVRRGQAVPPAAIVTQIWDAQEATRETLVAEHVRTGAAGGVHAGHDISLHRPLVVGEALRTWVDARASRPAGRHSLITLRYTTLDAQESIVAEQLWSTMYFGVSCAEVGEAVPADDIPDAARAQPLDTYSVDVDEDMARRYAEASGDWSAHHFDLEAAARTGFDRLFLHGLCTLGLAAQGVVARAANGDPDRVRRLAARFVSPAFLGDTLDVVPYVIDEDVIGFEATANGVLVLGQGRLELR